MAPAIDGSTGVAHIRVGVLSGGPSRGPENVGRKSSGGMLGGEETVERCVREEAWLIWLIDLFSGRVRKVE